MNHTSSGKKSMLRLALALGVSALIALPGASIAAGNGKNKKLTPMEFAKAAQVWQQVCGSCHNLRDPKELTDAQWDVAVGQMEVRAGLPPEQALLIRAFLKASN